MLPHTATTATTAVCGRTPHVNVNVNVNNLHVRMYRGEYAHTGSHVSTAGRKALHSISAECAPIPALPGSGRQPIETDRMHAPTA